MPEFVVYINGRWVPKSKASLSVFDHGVLYGDGVFEGIRAYDGHVFRLQQHLKRLNESAALVSLKIPKSPRDLTKIIYATLKRNRLKDAYIRLLVTRGVGDLGLDPRACPHPGLVVIVDKLRLFPAECYRNGLNAVFAKTRRNIPQALNPIIKSMNYLNNILAKIEANAHGVPEAIMLNIQGYVSECTGDNVFYVKGSRIVTPPVSAGVLKGITRDAIIEIIKKKSPYSIKEKLFNPRELLTADEVFFTGTAAEVIPVTRIGGKKIGSGKPGRVTGHLIEQFQRLIRAEAKRPIR